MLNYWENLLIEDFREELEKDLKESAKERKAELERYEESLADNRPSGFGSETWR